MPDKAVEKSTLSDLLACVDVTGAIISGDAHFTVPEVARQIVDSGADYLLAVKKTSQIYEQKWEISLLKPMQLIGKESKKYQLRSSKKGMVALKLEK